MPQSNFNRIKSALAEKRTTQKSLAEYLNVAEGTVSTWCRNSKQPEVATLFKIAEYLKIEARELLTLMKDVEK